jgi:RND superfamily putative drug exporter
MTALARWCCRHPWWVIGGWLLLLIFSTGASRQVGSAYANSFNLPNTDTQRATDLLQKDFPQAAGDLDQIVFHAKKGTVLDRAYLGQEKKALSELARLPHVSAVISPFTPQGATQINRDKTIAFADVQYDELPNVIPRHVLNETVSDAESIRSRYLDVELGGQAIEFLTQPSTHASEAAGIIGSAVVLFVAFGSWRGMVTPLITALSAIGVGVSIAALLSHATTVAPFAPQLSILIGLGVGVDYALFIVSRHRNNLLHGMANEDSIEAALNTSGRAVTFAAATVCVALLGMFLLNVTFIFGVAVCAAITVALTMVASLTLLPALLKLMGPRVLGRRKLARLEAEGPDDSHVTGGWLSWAKLVERRRVIFSVVAVAIVVTLAVPFFGMRLGFSDAGKDPSSQTTRQAYDLLSEGFGPGFNGPLQVIAAFNSPASSAAVKPLQAAVASTPGILGVSPPVFSVNRQTAIMQAIPASTPESVQTTNLVKHLRKTVIPPAIKGTPITVAYIGGATAAQIDFSHVVAIKLPVFVAVVVVLASLLLMIAFRSLLIPLVASVMNIFAAGATYGVLVYVYQHGHFASFLKTGGQGPIDAFLPVMLFAILFGLSMDYQVFLVSRMHEEWIHTGDNKLSVTVGQAETGRVITAAATIMILVFASFIFSGLRQLGEFGLGLSSAVFVDAFVIRTVLVPSLMHALGNANWYLPKWLDRVLPHVSIEPPDRTYDDDLTLADF